MAPAARDLPTWLAYQERLHTRPIDLGLDRVRTVWVAMGAPPAPAPVITVAGTNGKGSCVAFLESIGQAASARVASYTSPHLVRYNERVRIAGSSPCDEDWCEAFQRVEQARGKTPLTYFEFGTLAALHLIHAAEPDLIVLEVGLGGRLDAVNLVDADCAVVTSIGIDHVAWLGPDRESIGAEKAAVARPDRWLVCGDRDPPASIRATALETGAMLRQIGIDFDAGGATSRGWTLRIGEDRFVDLPEPAIPGDWQRDNAACAACALVAIGWGPRLNRPVLEAGLRQVAVAGRLQRLAADPPIYADVAHNPDAARALAGWMSRFGEPWTVVLGMLDDKDVAGFVEELAQVTARWVTVTLTGDRGLSARRLGDRVRATLPAADVAIGGNLSTALDVARRSGGQRPILVTGSFLTVADALLQMGGTDGDDVARSAV